MEAEWPHGLSVLLKVDSTRTCNRFPLKSVFAAFEDKKIEFIEFSDKSREEKREKGRGAHECDLLINGTFDSQGPTALYDSVVHATERARLGVGSSVLSATALPY